MMSEILSADSSLWICLWQSTVLVGLGLLSSFILRRQASRAHHVLFISMIAALIVPAAGALVRHFGLGILVARPAAVELQSENSVASANHEIPDMADAQKAGYEPTQIGQVTFSSAPVSHSTKFPRRSILLYGWIGASSILAARLLVTFFLGVRLLARTVPLNCEKIEHAIHLAVAQLGIDGNVQVRTSSRICSPVIWCWKRRPVLLLPATAGRGSKEIDWTGVLCHELAHWKRRDHISGLIAELAVCVLPWHPLLWWAKSRLIGLSEQACDDWVLSTGRSGANYAESLLNLRPDVQMAFVPAVVSSKSGLSNRVRRILEGKCTSPRTGLHWTLAVAAITGFVTVAVSFAQTRPAQPAATIRTKLSRTAVIEHPAFETMTIKGQILDPNNEPAYGASIVALPVTSWGYYTDPRNRNKDGYFELPWSPSWIEKNQPIYLMAIVQDPKSQGALVEITDPTSPVTIRLEPAFAITGKVVDPAGQEIEECLAAISLSTEFECRAMIYSFHVGKSWERMLSPLPYGAKYRLTVRAKGYQTQGIIVDGTDRSQKLIDLGTIILQPQDKSRPVAAEQFTDPDLAREFHEVYSLDKDEIIKFIKPPFVLGRQEYFQNPTSIYPRIFESLDCQGAIQACLLWDDGALKETPLYAYTNTHRPPTLEEILCLTLRMPHYDFNLPKELDIDMPYGDWIVRAGSPRNEQLRSMEEIIYAETNKAIRFEKRTAEREVIVAKGRYEFKPHPNGKWPNHIPITWDGTVSNPERTVDSLRKLFSSLEFDIETKIVDETEPMENTTIRYRKSSKLRWIPHDPELKPERINALLDNLAKTTSLQFTVERRPAEIWFVTEAKEN